jgi:hypothetical protein
MNVAPGATYEAVIDWGATGATLGLRVIDNNGATTVARLATSITEYPAGSGVYSRTGNTAPAVAGQYTLVWDDDGGTAATGHVATEELVVASDFNAGTVGTGNLYVTLAELKTTLNIGASTWDTDLTAAISAASRSIDQQCGRRFYLDCADVDRYYTPGTPGSVLIDDLATLTTVKTDTGGGGTFTTTLTAGTDFDLAPFNAAADGWPYTTIQVRQAGRTLPGYTRSVKVTGRFGWPSVPATIAEATTILAARLFKRAREAPFSMYGMGADGAPIRISRTDPDVCMLIDPYSARRMIL